jgi:hypothetical protein
MYFVAYGAFTTYNGTIVTNIQRQADGKLEQDL